jgi:hypothetical protein
MGRHRGDGSGRVVVVGVVVVVGEARTRVCVPVVLVMGTILLADKLLVHDLLESDHDGGCVGVVWGMCGDGRREEMALDVGGMAMRCDAGARRRWCCDDELSDFLGELGRSRQNPRFCRPLT